MKHGRQLQLRRLFGPSAYRQSSACALALLMLSVGIIAWGTIAEAQPRTPGPTATSGAKPTTKQGPGAAATGPGGAQLETTSEWDAAVNAFKYQDFDNAIPKLRALLYPKPQLDTAREWRAREYLGAALWWTGRKQEALDEFTALLVRNPPARLDPASYPPPMIQDFETLRGNLLRLGVLRVGQKPAVPKAPPSQWVAPRALTLFPLGVGQFANQQPGKGVAFLASESALGISSVALYLYNRDQGLSSRSDALPRAAQVTTGALFWAVAAWGVVDAWIVRAELADAVAAARQNLKAPQP